MLVIVIFSVFKRKKKQSSVTQKSYQKQKTKTNKNTLCCLLRSLTMFFGAVDCDDYDVDDDGIGNINIWYYQP